MEFGCHLMGISGIALSSIFEISTSNSEHNFDFISIVVTKIFSKVFFFLTCSVDFYNRLKLLKMFYTLFIF